MGRPIPWLAERDADGRTFAADDDRHGTSNGYSNHECRCPDCTEAWRVKHHEYMNANPDRMWLHAMRERMRRRAKAARQ